MRLELEIGALCRPISEQIRERGIALSDADARHIDADAAAINRLRIRGVLTDAEARSASKRLVRILELEVGP